MSNQNNRSQSMNWWNNLASPQKTQLCDTNSHIVGVVRRWETLTGYEIEKLWRQETNNIENTVFKETFYLQRVSDGNYHRGSKFIFGSPWVDDKFCADGTFTEKSHIYQTYIEADKNNYKLVK